MALNILAEWKAGGPQYFTLSGSVWDGKKYQKAIVDFFKQRPEEEWLTIDIQAPAEWRWAYIQNFSYYELLPLEFIDGEGMAFARYKHLIKREQVYGLAMFGAKPTAIRMSVETFEHFKIETEDGQYCGLPIYFDDDLQIGEVTVEIA